MTITDKAMKVARTRTEARAAEILGRPVDGNGVDDILWMIAVAVGFAREKAESPAFGPDDMTTHSYRQLAEQLQRGL